MSAPSSVGASVDLGSNSVHLLVAAVTGHRLEPIIDESAFLGLGAAVDERGPPRAPRPGPSWSPPSGAMSRPPTWSARPPSRLVGTEPIRRAADAARIVADVEAGTGVPLHVLTHEEEAFLTLIGVTEGRPVTHETLVVDIGGGSSEFCAVGRSATPARPACVWAPTA